MLERLITPHGDLLLPAFLPDATHGVLRAVDWGDAENARTQGVVMNTYHLLNKPGIQTIKAAGSLHAFTGFEGPILTDSGGFQVFSLLRENPKYGQIRENEVIFRPEGGRGKQVLTPEKCIQAQLGFRADIAMCLDCCTHPGDGPEITRDAVRRTLKWGLRCKETFEGRPDREDGRRLFAILQGGADPELRRECGLGLRQIGFDGYAFGGWPLDAEGNFRPEILRMAVEAMPEGAPRYAMGVGKPEEIVRCAGMGYDLFDCVIPTREARHNRLYVWKASSPEEADLDGDFYEPYYILDDKHHRAEDAISGACDCYTCRRYSRSYLRHLFRVGDSLAYRLATIHNLAFYNQLMEQIRARRQGASRQEPLQS